MLCPCGCSRALGYCPVGVEMGHARWRERQAAMPFRWVNIETHLPRRRRLTDPERMGIIQATASDWYEMNGLK
jgi:hypothetical protein